MPPRRFDLRLLFDEIDRERTRRELSWTALARHVGVAASTIRRFETADDAEADGVLALIGWLGTSPEDYIQSNEVPGRRLSTIPDHYLRVDMAVIDDLTASKPTGRTRTTIQRLVQAAQQAGKPVADLTRYADARP